MPSTTQSHAKKTPNSRHKPTQPSEKEVGHRAAETDTAPLNPTLLTPRHLLQLQRTIGNAAVTRLLAANGARPAAQAVTRAASPLLPTIQRKIGFEIETRIPLYNETAPNTYTNPGYNTINADVGTGDGSKVSVDKTQHNSIIEFVSGPVDDTQKDRSFKATARRWVNILTDLRAEAANTPPLKDLHAKFGGAPVNSRYGFLNNDDTSQMDSLAIQVTHGLRLDQMQKYLEKFTIKNKWKGSLEKKEKAVHDTNTYVDTLMTTLEGILDPAAVIRNSGERKKALKEVRGFFSLIVHYLLVGNQDIKSYIKNQTSLFYKSKLSDVLIQLILNNNYAAHLLQDTYRTNVKDELLNVTGRDVAEPVFTDGVTTCGVWLDEVLQGIDDKVFDEAKNSWGQAIDPGKVKGHLAAVVEHRDLSAEMPAGDDMTLANPDEVVNYLLKVYQFNKKVQDL